MSESEVNYVYLKCVKEGGKLRVKVTSNGYLKEANTQFPKDIRVDGRRFKVRASDINLIQTRGKYFYSVKKKDKITIIDDNEDIDVHLSLDLSKIKIHTDEEITDCVICMENVKEIIFSPCGHFYSCINCSSKVTKCPMCRTVIVNRINRADFG